MANNREIKLKITLDSKGAVTSIQTLDSSLSNSKEKVNLLNDTLARLGLRMDGLKNIMSLVGGTFGAWIEESDQGQESLSKLEQSLKTQGIYSKSLVKDIQDYAAARQEATGIDDDATTAIAGQLTAMGLRGQALMNAINTTQDLATFMKVDLNTAVRLVGKSMQDGGEELSRYGIKLSDVRGQAIAMATENKKNAATLGDFKQSLGDLIKDVINPYLSFGREIIKSLTDVSPAVKAIEISAISTFVAWRMMNSAFGLTGGIIAGLVSGIFIMTTALDNGEPAIAATTAAVGMLGGALAMIKLQPILNLVPIVNQLTVSLASMSAVSLGLVGAIVAGTIALGVAWYKVFTLQEKLQKDHDERFKKSTESLANDIAHELDGLTKEEKVIRLKWNMQDAEYQLGILKKQLASLEQWKGLARDEEGIKRLKEQIQIQQSVVDANKKELASFNEKEQKIKESAQIQNEIAAARANAMNEGIKKQEEIENVAFKKYMDDLEKRRTSDKDDAINKDQFNALKEAAEKKHQNALNKIKFDAIANDVKEQEEAVQKNMKRAGDALGMNLDLQEKQKLATATSEGEREKIQKEFAQKRIQNERNVAVFAIESQQKVLNAQITALKNSGGDPKKIAELQSAFDQLDLDKKPVNDKAINATMGLDADETARNFQLKKELAEQYAQFQTEQIKNEFTRARKVEDDKYKATKDRINNSTLLEEEKTDALKKLDEQHLATKKEIDKQELRSIKDKFAEEHQIAMSVFSGIAAGVGSMWQQFVVKNRQAKDEWDAVWLAMRNTTLNILGNILERQVENYLIDTAAHNTAETTKTAVTEGNALTRVATTVWETTTKIGMWAGEQIAFIAKEVAMTAVAVVQGGIRIAIILAEAAANIVKVVAEAIAALGPFGLIAGAGIAAAGAALWGSVKKTFGFREGGQFESDQRGFIEGGQTEIIAPRKNFEEIMRNEIMPMISKTQLVYLMRGNITSPVDNTLLQTLQQEFRSMKKTMRKIKPLLVLNARTVPVEFSEAEERSADYRAAIAL